MSMSFMPDSVMLVDPVMMHVDVKDFIRVTGHGVMITVCSEAVVGNEVG
jgi:hypothetical protein